MKKVLIITLEYPPQIGGISSYTHELAKVLGSGTVILAPLNPASAPWDQSVGYTLIRKRLFFPKFIWPSWLKLFFIVQKIIRKQKIEVLLIHHVLPVGYIGWLVEKIFHVPYIIFFHGADLTSRKSSTAWKRRLVQLVGKGSGKVVVNSLAMKRHVKAFIYLTDDQIVVVNPCPAAIFLQRPGAEELDLVRRQYALEGKRILLSVSRLGQGKGFPHLLRLIPNILNSIPQLVLLIVGDGPKRDELLKFVQAHNLQNVVRFIGPLTAKELRLFYYLADVFVLLTHDDDERGQEGFGLVFLEAAAAELPVVAGRSGGVEEAVINGQTGLVVDIYQERQVEDAIISLFTKPDLAKQLGELARERIEREFQLSKQIEKIFPWL